MKKVKALVLLSGGLDSMLAVKILQEQGIEVSGITFESNFYNAEKAKRAVKQLGISLKIIDIRKEMLDLVKNPPNGHGKNLNPCIDCHALMIRKASEFLKNQPHPSPLLKNERGLISRVKKLIFRPSSLPRRRTGGSEEFDVIATGEVAGQRPFSQTKQALQRVEKNAGVEVLRPLSAKLLPETEYEKKGLVDRSKLLDISGRGRERQMELAKKFGIKEYPSPGGGCLLTEFEFSVKLREMKDSWKDCDAEDVELLKHGRVYWVNSKNAKTLIVVGRNKEDNKELERLVEEGDILVELDDFKGPITLIRNKKQETRNKQIPNSNPPAGRAGFQIPDELDVKDLKLEQEKSEEEILEIAGILTGYHAPKARGKKVNFLIKYS